MTNRLTSTEKSMQSIKPNKIINNEMINKEHTKCLSCDDPKGWYTPNGHYWLDTFNGNNRVKKCKN